MADPDELASLRLRADGGEYIASAELATLLAARRDDAAMSELRARADARDHQAASALAGVLAERGDDEAVAELRILAAQNNIARYRLIGILASRADEAAVAELHARVAGGDKEAAGRLGELLAGRGDAEGALRVWAQGYSDDDSATRRRLAELLVERGDVAGAVWMWCATDVIWQNPAGCRAVKAAAMDPDDWADDDSLDPEDWGYTEDLQLTRMLITRGDDAALAELRARADAGSVTALAWRSGRRVPGL